VRSHFVSVAASAVISTTCLAGFTSDSYVDLAMYSTDGDFNLYNDASFQVPGQGYTFIGGTPFGQSAMDYSISLSTVSGSSGIVGGSAGDTDVVDFSITVTNTSGSTHFYTLFISTGITTPWSGGTFLTGEVAGTVFELGPTPGDADFFNNGNSPLMQGLIDNNPALPVGSAPFSVPATPEGTIFVAANAGMGPMDVVSSYGLILTFGLQGEDQVVIDGQFTVTYIPGPATLALMAVGLAAGRRRRN